MLLSRFMLSSFLVRSQIGKTQITGRGVARWVAPTLRELKRRDKLLGPKAPEPRSGFVEWNFRAELYAFGKRLQEDFKLPLLQTAFTHSSFIQKEQKRQLELGIDVSEVQTVDNSELTARGQHILSEYVEAYLQHTLPKVPDEGRKALWDYLLSEAILANISFHLGTKELIFAAEYPPTEETLAKTFLAIVGALEKSTGLERAFVFVRDFVCTQLNQKDLLEIWHIENPEAMLQRLCEERKLGEPEPRLLSQCGKNTVLAAYNVGIYCNKDMIADGFGEDIETARKAASLKALQSLFGIGDNMRPFDFQLQVTPKSMQLEHK